MFDKLADNVQSIIDNIEPLIVKEMKLSEAEIIDMNVEQLSESLTSEGKLLPKYRNPDYAEYKARKGNTTGRWDLQDEGDYVGGIFTEPDKDSLTIDTKDEKKKKFSNYEPLGLIEKNKEKLAETILEPLQNEIKKQFLQGVT